MTKQEFITRLEKGFSGLPKRDAEERVAFYSEMIDDRIEDGTPEAIAVAELGSPDDIVAQTIADFPLAKLVKEKIKPKKRPSGIVIALLILGFPLWFPLLVAAFAVGFALYVVFWTVIIALWAVVASVAACALAGVVGGVYFAFGGNLIPAVAVIGAGLCCAGLAVFLFYGCKAVVKAILSLTKCLAVSIKNALMHTEKTA